MHGKRKFLKLSGLIGITLLLFACTSVDTSPTPSPQPPTATPVPQTPTLTQTPKPTKTPTPIPAEDLLEYNQEAMEELETLLLSMDMEIQIGDQSIVITMVGSVENPDKSYFEVSMPGQEKSEVVTLSDEDIYTREAGSHVWIKSSLTDASFNYDSQFAPLDMAKSVVLEGEESFSEVDNYVIAYTIDMSKFLASDPTMSQMISPLQSTGTGKIWIGKQDYLTRKFFIEINFEQYGQEFTYEAEVSGYNEPVQIPDPAPYYTQIVLHASDPVFEVTFSPDSSLLAACDDDQFIHLWTMADLEAEKLIIEHPDLKKEQFIQTADFYALAFSPDGQTLAAGSQGQVFLYSLTDLTGEPMELNPSNVAIEMGNDFEAVAFSPDGKYLAAGGAMADIYFWSIENLEAPPRALKGHQAPVIDLTFTHDGETLISGGADGTILLWNVENLIAPLHTLSGHSDDFHALEMTTDDEYLLSVGFKDPVYVWSLTQPENSPDAIIPRTDDTIGKLPTLDIAVSPDGRTLATADTLGVVRLWSLSNPQTPYAVLSTQSQYDLMTIAFSADGRYLATGGGDAVVNLWILEGE